MTLQTMTDHDPKITIIVPVYNCTDYLPECMDTILRQTVSDFEVILVEDNSSDHGRTLAMARAYEREDQRVKVVQTPQNVGCGMARNYGMRYARGRYLMFVDADDTIELDMLEQMAGAAEKYDADIVRCKYDVLYSSGRVAGRQLTGEPEVYDDPSVIHHIALCVFSPPADPKVPNRDFGGAAWMALYRRDLIVKHDLRFPDMPHFLSEDYPFAYRLLRHVRRYVRLPRTLYHYRQVEGSITHATRLDMVERVVKSAEYFEQLIKEDPGYKSGELHYARGYVVASLRGYLKQVFMSKELSMAEKKEWFMKQQDHHIIKVCYATYPWRKLPFKHRLGFEAFYNRRFMLLYGLIVGQEKVRKLLGKA